MPNLCPTTFGLGNVPSAHGVRLAALSMFMLALIGMPGGDAFAICPVETDSCESAWISSVPRVNETCQEGNVSADCESAPVVCEINTVCTNDAGASVTTSILLEQWKVSSLKNCDGTLTYVPGPSC